jgi:hypothetical protein
MHYIITAVEGTNRTMAKCLSWTGPLDLPGTCGVWLEEQWWLSAVCPVKDLVLHLDNTACVRGKGWAEFWCSVHNGKRGEHLLWLEIMCEPQWRPQKVIQGQYWWGASGRCGQEGPCCVNESALYTRLPAALFTEHSHSHSVPLNCGSAWREKQKWLTQYTTDHKWASFQRIFWKKWVATTEPVLHSDSSGAWGKVPWDGGEVRWFLVFPAAPGKGVCDCSGVSQGWT